jgi:hypothetical protein
MWLRPIRISGWNNINAATPRSATWFLVRVSPLVAVPFWWDGRKERYIVTPPISFLLRNTNTSHSLAATIKKSRPELIQGPLDEGEEGIPESMPEYVRAKATPNVPGVGEPSAACFFTLSSIDPTNWYITHLSFSRPEHPNQSIPPTPPSLGDRKVDV